MADNKDIVRLAVDRFHGKVEGYSEKESSNILYQAILEANNGKTYLDVRDIRDRKCPELFAIIEEVLGQTVVEGLQGNEFFNTFVEFRNTAEGDKNDFVVEDTDLFVVAKTADGTQGIRRQRLGGANSISIATETRSVRIYEELNRVLAGRVDFNKLITKVTESFKQQILNDIYTLWIGVTANQIGGATYYPGFSSAGTYNDAALLDLIDHVEAKAGGDKIATIIGTRKAARNLGGGQTSEEAKGDLYRNGQFGWFYGSPIMITPQRHKIGTTTFVLNDNALTVVAGDPKPIKLVYEGDPLMIPGDPTKNADLTQEYFFSEKWGLGLVMANDGNAIGRYLFS